MENEVDKRTRDIVGKAQKASKSLISTIEIISKLSETEDKPVDPLYKTFNLKLTGKSPINLCDFVLIFLSIKGIA